jgi:heme oxygenase
MSSRKPDLSGDYRTLRSLSQALRAETRDWHAIAEEHPFETRLLSGKATRDDYARYLGQLFHVHSALEASLRTLAASHPVFGGVVCEYHYREGALRADLRTLGQTPDSHPPLAATRLLRQRIEALTGETPLALLGILYVLEGSTNGGRFIARAIRRAMPLPMDAGTAYLDPHGASQRERWERFRMTLDTLDLRSEDRDAIIGAACDAFRGVHDILQDLTHAPPTVVVVRPPATDASARP